MMGLWLTACSSPLPDLTRLTSPDGRIAVTFHVAADTGQPEYSVFREGKEVLRDSHLGLVRDDADLTHGLHLVQVARVSTVRDDYELLTTKRRHNHYEGRRQAFTLADAAGHQLEIVFQVSDDGVALRYRFPETRIGLHTIKSEATSYHFPMSARAWLQPIAVAKSGWKRTNPSYEEYHQRDIPVGKPSDYGAGWVYPALFHVDDTWVVVSETSLDRTWCATRLSDQSPDGEYTVTFPDPREEIPDKGVLPEGKLPWASPWRIIALGDLQTIVESTLGTDLADPPSPETRHPDRGPGKASWSWPLMGDDQTRYDTQRRFIDYAADMGWRYCLIDAQWDTQIGYEKMQDLVNYAHGRHVDILLWYNSNGNWNDAPQTPRGILSDTKSRRVEFGRLVAMGVAGVKIDFFGGDGRSMIAYYHDILDDAARAGLLVNFHGTTLPRGWERTYPNLMTMEAIRGLEFITFEQANADRAPAHMAMQPFTRNLWDPMDFTPVVLDHINRIQRRTSSAAELALSVLFTSGIQHYAEIPEGMAKAPPEVRDFLKGVPSIWDDVRFLDGYPGKFVVLARRSGTRWWLAGLNAETTPQELSLDLSRLNLPPTATGQIISDGDSSINLSFRNAPLTITKGDHLELTLQPHGGFVATLE